MMNQTKQHPEHQNIECAKDSQREGGDGSHLPKRSSATSSPTPQAVASTVGLLPEHFTGSHPDQSPLSTPSSSETSVQRSEVAGTSVQLSPQRSLASIQDNTLTTPAQLHLCGDIRQQDLMTIEDVVAFGKNASVQLHSHKHEKTQNIQQYVHRESHAAANVSSGTNVHVQVQSVSVGSPSAGKGSPSPSGISENQAKENSKHLQSRDGGGKISEKSRSQLHSQRSTASRQDQSQLSMPSPSEASAKRSEAAGTSSQLSLQQSTAVDQNVTSMEQPQPQPQLVGSLQDQETSVSADRSKDPQRGEVSQKSNAASNQSSVSVSASVEVLNPVQLQLQQPCASVHDNALAIPAQLQSVGGLRQQDVAKIKEVVGLVGENASVQLHLHKHENIQQNIQEYVHKEVHAATNVSGGTNVHVEVHKISVGETSAEKESSSSSDISENQAKSIGDFLNLMEDHLMKICSIYGKHRSLERLEEYVELLLSTIKMEGKMGERLDFQSIKSKIEKQGPFGTDLEVIQLNQIHENSGNSDVCHVLFAGDAGEGKTTAAKEYAKRVIQGHVACLKGIRLVLFISIMEIDFTSKTTPFALLITKLLGKLEERLQSVAKKWMEENSHEILMVFDGLDQSSISLQQQYPKTDHEARTEPIIILSNILSGHIYSNAKIVTTSRWHSFWTLEKDLKPDRIVALRGFSQDQVKALLRKLVQVNPDLVIDHISKYAPNLLHLCSTPNILFNTASVLSQSPKFRPDTQTEILAYVVIHLIASICGVVPIIRIAELAYFGIVNGIFQFSYNDFERFGLQPPDLHEFTSSYAVLIPDQMKVKGSNLRYYFYHQTIQEFFAALHICNMTDDVSPCLEALLKDAKLENVFIFLSGIVGHSRTLSVVQENIFNGGIFCQNIREILKQKIVSTFQGGSIVDIKVCRALQECDSDFFQETTATVTEVRVPVLLEPRDSILISSTMSKLSNLNLVDLRNLELNNFTVTLLTKSIDSVKHLKIEAINTSHNKNLDHATYKLMTAAAPSNLYVNDNNLQEDDVKQLIEGVKESGGELSQLSFEENRNLTPSTMSLLAKFIGHGQAKQIFMGDCDLDEEKLEAFYNGLKGQELEIELIDIQGNKTIEPQGFRYVPGIIQVGHVQEFQIMHCNLSDEKVEILAKHAMQSNIELRVFVINENKDIGVAGSSSLVDFIQHTNLKNLHMRDCNLDDKKMKSMAERSEGKQLELKVFVIDGNKNIGVVGSCSLVDFIQHTNLEQLQMVNCNLDDEKVKAMAERSEGKQLQLQVFAINGNKDIGVAGSSSLVDFIQHTSLKKLYMKDCNLHDKKMKVMAERSEGKQLELQAFVIDGNKNIGVAGSSSLVDFIQHTHLERLRMKDCNLDDEKVKAMAERSEGKQLQLEIIIFNKNRNIGPDGCKCIVDFLKQTRLGQLSMEDCDLTTIKVKAMTAQVKARELKIPRLDVSNNIPSDSNYMDEMSELISSADSEVVWMDDCQLTTDHMESLCRNLLQKNKILEGLDLSQNTPNPKKEYLHIICKLLHCVSERMTLHKWKFDDDDLVTLKQELQNTPFKELEIAITDAYGEVIMLRREESATSKDSNDGFDGNDGEPAINDRA